MVPDPESLDPSNPKPVFDPTQLNALGVDGDKGCGWGGMGVVATVVVTVVAACVVVVVVATVVAASVVIMVVSGGCQWWLRLQ